MIRLFIEAIKRAQESKKMSVVVGQHKVRFLSINTVLKTRLIFIELNILSEEISALKQDL